MGLQAVSGEGQVADVSAGSVIAGRFRIERRLGSGGMAEVFASRDLATGRPLAVKLLKRDAASNPEAVERLRREGEVLKKLEHPTIVRLETFGKLDDGRLFIAMELLEGETLGARMRREGRMEPADLSPVVAGVCAGLSAAHEAGIVHRDLKPDNIFLEGGPHGIQVKLLDFGISKITGSDKLTETGQVLGTPRYMAPEQLSAERELDGRTDVYALGVILYEALAGSPPFLATTPTDLVVAILHGKVAPLRSFRPDLPEGIDTLVARAMSRAREARPGSAREFAEAWLAVVGPAERSSLPGPAREGMTTSPLGTLDETPSGERRADTDANDEPLRPGTFSALAAAPAEVAAPVVAGASAPADPPASAERGTKRRTAAPGPAPASGSAAEGRPRRRGRTGAHRVPTSGGRTLLVVGGVVAGALSAALAIGALKVLNADVEAEPAAAAASDAPPAAVEPGAEFAPAPAPPGAGVAKPSPATGEPAAAEPSAETGGAEADGDAADDSGDEAAGRSPRRRGRRSGGRGAGPSASSTIAGAAGPAGDPAPGPSGEGEVSAAELMRQARAALRRGDAETCLNAVERAIEAGATSLALRLRGDCLLRAGDRIEALKSYERFCRLAPDHPAIGEVRAVVESLGGRCD